MSKYLLPSFIIIGERKCGTSSLYRYLLDHPQILPCKVKEPQFFSRSRLGRMLYWHHYQTLFPLRNSEQPVRLRWHTLRENGQLTTHLEEYARPGVQEGITGEASANTMAAARPEVVMKYLPDVIPIALLRDPVSRAISHHRMLLRFQREGRRLPRKIEPLRRDIVIDMKAFETGGLSLYIGLGCYALQLRSWKQTFGKRLKIIFTSHMAQPESAQEILNKLTEIFGLESHSFDRVTRKMYNTAAQQEDDNQAAGLLRQFYAPFDKMLDEELNLEVPWT